MRSIRFVLLATFASTIISAPSALAQTGAPKLEIGTRQGDYYWVVETSPDGSRRGGWVNVAIPLNAIDRSALKPLPPAAPSAAETSVQAPPPPAASSLDERLTRIEQALSAKQGTTQVQVQETPAIRSTALTQVSQPGPQEIMPVRFPQSREGFWFSGGMGVGVAGCVGCVGREVGASGGLSLGGTISDRVLLGVGTSGWYKTIDGVSVNGGTFDTRIRFYPAVSSGFYLTAGAGLGSIAASNGVSSEREVGLGVLLRNCQMLWIGRVS